ncbi:exonuclease II Exo2 [Coemansia erecta]|uniref:Exonuclease II Exo2 n=1 Tax=Coemansia erecta TaxID=147472 RepID=A0A9W7XVW2_9FUNG|nr:exonuclease II Exo2 [Coemansia erecta]
MGVPGLMRWFHRNFPAACRLRTHFGNQDTVHSLFIDLNSTLHQSSRINDGDVSSVSTAINKIFKRVKPQRLLYIAIDGVPPRIKEHLQRQRRSKNIGGTAADGKPEKAFSSYMITPGTEWMRSVEQHMVKYIEERRMTSPRWKDIKIIFSGSGDPGEGEQKIMNYLRSQASRDEEHCVWSSDADSILLSLATHVPNITVVNCNSDVETGQFYAVSIDRLAKQMALKYSGSTYEKLSRLRQNQTVDDLVFMSFFFGNDFLPSRPFVKVDSDASCVDSLWSMYARLSRESQCLVQQNGEISVQAFKALLRMNIGDIEDREFRKLIGVTPLGSQVTTLRARHLDWDRQRLKLADKARSSVKALPEKKPTKRKAKAGRLVPFVWTGNVDELAQVDFDQRSVAELSGAYPVSSIQNIEYRTAEECLATNTSQLSIDGMPLVSPALMSVVQAAAAVVSGHPSSKTSVPSTHISSGKLKWIPTFANSLGLECTISSASGAIGSPNGTRSKRQRTGDTSATSDSSDVETRRSATVSIGDPGLLLPMQVIRLFAKDSMSQRTNSVKIKVALVSDDDWNTLLGDAKIEHKRRAELQIWKAGFYKQAYRSCADEPGFVDSLCALYANALGWTARYYFAGEVSCWDFAWPVKIEMAYLGVAPMDSDLLAYLDRASSGKRWDCVPVSDSEPPVLLEHQLSVMPVDAWAHADQNSHKALAERLNQSEYSDETRAQIRSLLIKDGHAGDYPCVHFWR